MIVLLGNGILNVVVVVVVVSSEICRVLFLPTHLNFGPYVMRYQRTFHCLSLDHFFYFYFFVRHQDPNICHLNVFVSFKK